MAPIIQFHKKAKILSIRFNKNKSVDSDIQDNVVVDYDKNGQLVNLDIMDIHLTNFVKVKDLNKLKVKQPV